MFVTHCRSPCYLIGTNVSVYGAQVPRPSGNTSAVPPSVSFAIDGVIPMEAVSDPDVNTTDFAFQFFDSHTLPAGGHVLKITVEYGSDDWPFVLDYIEYTAAPAPTGSIVCTCLNNLMRKSELVVLRRNSCRTDVPSRAVSPCLVCRL